MKAITKKAIVKALKEEERYARELEIQLLDPSTTIVKIRGQLVVIDYPDYHGRGLSMTIKDLVAAQIRQINSGELPIAYAENCKKELIDAIALIDDALKEKQQAT